MKWRLSVEELKHNQAESFLEMTADIAAQIRLGGFTGLCLPPRLACPPLFNLGLDMARQGAARADIDEVIGIFLASSGEAFMGDPLNRFSVAALGLILDGEGPEALRDEFETAVHGKPRQEFRDRRPPVFAVAPDGKEARVEWAVNLISSRQDLVVRGDVRDGLSMKTTGSIRVAGQVGAANLEAGGGIEVEGCVFGKGKAVLICGGDFSATALERARVSAGGGVSVGAVVEAIELACAGDLVCEGGSSTIVGGTVRAGGSVRAGTIGGPLCTKTFIGAGDPELKGNPDSELHRTPSGGAAITVLGTIHERAMLSVGRSRMQLSKALSGVKIREDSLFLKVEASDAL
jgi:hypothetical protein